jgi:hypothetical protein
VIPFPADIGAIIVKDSAGCQECIWLCAVQRGVFLFILFHIGETDQKSKKEYEIFSAKRSQAIY